MSVISTTQLSERSERVELRCDECGMTAEHVLAWGEVREVNGEQCAQLTTDGEPDGWTEVNDLGGPHHCCLDCYAERNPYPYPGEDGDEFEAAVEWNVRDLQLRLGPDYPFLDLDEATVLAYLGGYPSQTPVIATAFYRYWQRAQLEIPDGAG